MYIIFVVRNPILKHDMTEKGAKHIHYSLVLSASVYKELLRLISFKYYKRGCNQSISRSPCKQSLGFLFVKYRDWGLCLNWVLKTNSSLYLFKGVRSLLLQMYPKRDITNIVESSHYLKIGSWCRAGSTPGSQARGKCKTAKWVKPFRCLGKFYFKLKLILVSVCEYF